MTIHLDRATRTQDLPLSGQIIAALVRAGINSLGELDARRDSISDIDGIGPARAEEVRKVLRAYDMQAHVRASGDRNPRGCITPSRLGLATLFLMLLGIVVATLANWQSIRSNLGFKDEPPGVEDRSELLPDPRPYLPDLAEVEIATAEDLGSLTCYFKNSTGRDELDLFAYDVSEHARLIDEGRDDLAEWSRITVQGVGGVHAFEPFGAGDWSFFAWDRGRVVWLVNKKLAPNTKWLLEVLEDNEGNLKALFTRETPEGS